MPPSRPSLPANELGGITPSSGETYPVWIGRRAQRHPDRVALTFIADDGSEISWTYGELWRRASDLASRLPQVQEDSPRALLLFPPGLEFLVGFFGCQLAGWTPVPTCYPKPGREMPRLDSAARDCKPQAIIGDRLTLDGIDSDKLSPEARQVHRVATESATELAPAFDPESLDLDPESLALLQYTSGSTSDPRGVMVRHRNLMANLDAIRRGFQVPWQDDKSYETDIGVFWLPFFHDMGLIGGILSPLYVGGSTVLMSPRSFLQRPLRWLQRISKYRARISGAPNFAYQLCLDRISPEQAESLDLSCWTTAFCGAEPIAARTLSGFAARFAACGFQSSAFYPCYGLAEATLLAAGGKGPAEPKVLRVERKALAEGHASVAAEGNGAAYQQLVSCGQPSFGTDLAIVDPDSRQRVAEGTVGEIWLTGESITAGYWQRPEENASYFEATLIDDDRRYCRTGDLGFLLEGELYVTGRRKDVIVLRGRNHFPQDIEATVKGVMGQEWGQCAAFAVDAPRGEALAIVAELPRRADQNEFAQMVREIRRAVIDVHEVDPRHVLLVRQATVPLTTSGKIQRSRCRHMFDRDELNPKYRYDQSSASEQSPLAMPKLPPAPTAADLPRLSRIIEDWMTEWLIARAGVSSDDFELEKPFAEYGLDSITAVELSGELESWTGVELTPVVAWNYPTVGRLAAYIAQQLVAEDSDADAAEASDRTDTLASGEDDLERLLGEVEQLSDEEIDHALADKRRP